MKPRVKVIKIDRQFSDLPYHIILTILTKYFILDVNFSDNYTSKKEKEIERKLKEKRKKESKEKKEEGESEENSDDDSNSGFTTTSRFETSEEGIVTRIVVNFKPHLKKKKKKKKNSIEKPQEPEDVVYDMKEFFGRFKKDYTKKIYCILRNMSIKSNITINAPESVGRYFLGKFFAGRVVRFVSEQLKQTPVSEMESLFFNFDRDLVNLVIPLKFLKELKNIKNLGWIYLKSNDNQQQDNPLRTLSQERDQVTNTTIQETNETNPEINERLETNKKTKYFEQAIQSLSPSIQKLALTVDDLSNDLIKKINSMENLKKFELQVFGKNEEEVNPKITHNLVSKSIQEIKIESYHFGAFGYRFMQDFPDGIRFDGMKNLKKVSFAYSPINSKILTSLYLLKQIKELSFNFCRVKLSEKEKKGEIPVNEALKQLRIFGNYDNNFYRKTITSALNLKKLSVQGRFDEDLVGFLKHTEENGVACDIQNQEEERENLECTIL